MISKFHSTIKVLAAVSLFGVLTACNEFLEEQPSKSTSVTIKTTADLEAVLNNYSSFFKEKDNIAIYSVDDNGFSGALYDASPFRFSSSVIQFSLWDINYLPQTDQSNFLGSNFWSGEYTKIFTANLVLASLNDVSGSDQEKENLRTDAHLIRAYSYWQLANTYCLPYTDANKNETGLPIKTLPNFDVPARSTLEETYRQIESDLTEALKTTVPLVQRGVARHWRANIAAANGFAARYYLHVNRYDKALEHANAALAHYDVLVDYKSEMYFGNPINVFVNGQLEKIELPYTHNRSTTADPTDILGWKEFLYFRTILNDDQWFIPSEELLHQYDSAIDLRYQYHIAENFSYSKFVNDVNSPGYVFFSDDALPEGPTTAEMVLIKAECLARTGLTDAAMSAVNTLYSKRTVAGTPMLTATSASDALAVILRERRRELPFSQRWFDIRRLNTNTDPTDDVPVLKKVFYPYTANSVATDQPLQDYALPKDSRRFASPLPQEDITNSNGRIIQNRY